MYFWDWIEKIQNGTTGYFLPLAAFTKKKKKRDF